jgi:hypothetical protein
VVGRNYLAFNSATQWILEDAARTARLQSDLERMFRRSLAETVAASVAAQMERMFPRGLTESFAASAAAQMERHLKSIHGGITTSIEAAAQRMLDQVNQRATLEGSLAAAAAAEAVRVSSLAHRLTGLEEAAREMQRRMDLTQSITADWMRLSEIATRPYRNIADAIGSSLAADSVARMLGGSWHDALGENFALQVQKAFEEQVAEDPEQSFLEGAVAAVVGLLVQAAVKVDSRLIVALVIGLMSSYAFSTPEASVRIDAESQVAEINWHVDRQLQRQNVMIEVFATKVIVHGTRMWTRPDSGSKVIGRIAKGTLVIPRARKGKWTEVVVRPEDSPTGKAIAGWMLNKYVKLPR